MATGSIVIGMLWVFVALGGAGAFFRQAIQHWRSRTPISSSKNLLVRLVWLLVLGILGIALVASEGLGTNTVICAAFVMMGMTAWVLFWGYFIEQQVNRAFTRSEKDKLG